MFSNLVDRSIISLPQPVRTVESGETVTMEFRVLESVCAKRAGQGTSANWISVSQTAECKNTRFWEVNEPEDVYFQFCTVKQREGTWLMENSLTTKSVFKRRSNRTGLSPVLFIRSSSSSSPA